MNNTDKNSPSTSQEDEMTTQVSLGATALGLLGLSSLDEQTDRAMTIAMRKLSELDARHPDLGIGERMRAAIHTANPAAEIRLVLAEFRDQVTA